MFSAKEHCFVICAYKENKHLEDTVVSLLNQTVKSDVYISTSTPNAFIEGICQKYQLEMFVNRTPKNAGADWNWAYDMAPTPLVTIAHQDDIYEAEFLEETLKELNQNPNAIMSYTNYYEIKLGKKESKNLLLMIKHLLNSPMLVKSFRNTKFFKSAILSLGCPICCPAVTFNKPLAGQSIFDTTFINSCDYKTWVDLSKKNGSFVYINKALLGHRIYAESATSKNLGDNIRQKEDLEILSLFWPRPIANLINKVYAQSEKSNKI
ncbi:glycosyltransferase [Streptococcus iniae]|uniref:glycosyltransferase n=1 Tax=Streptococcus iniae TaxID=1346 RepID=UPI003D9876D0